MQLYDQVKWILPKISCLTEKVLLIFMEFVFGTFKNIKIYMHHFSKICVGGSNYKFLLYQHIFLLNQK